MRLFKGYYPLQFKIFKSVLEYLTHIKILKKNISTSKVILSRNNSTILRLSISFDIIAPGILVSHRERSTLGFKAKKVRQIVLQSNHQDGQSLYNSHHLAIAIRASTREPCKHY